MRTTPGEGGGRPGTSSWTNTPEMVFENVDIVNESSAVKGTTARVHLLFCSRQSVHLPAFRRIFHVRIAPTSNRKKQEMGGFDPTGEQAKNGKFID